MYAWADMPHNCDIRGLMPQTPAVRPLLTPFSSVTVAPLERMTDILSGGRCRSDLAPQAVGLSRISRPSGSGECRAVRPYWLRADAIHAACGGTWRDHPLAVRDCRTARPPGVDRVSDAWCPDCGEPWNGHADGSRLTALDQDRAYGRPATDQPELHDVVDDVRRQPALWRYRERDDAGRFLADPPAPDDSESVPDNEYCYRRIRAHWNRLPHGSRKPFCRQMRLPASTVRGIARGRAAIPARTQGGDIVPTGLPEAVRRRIGRFFDRLDRQELELVRLLGHHPNGCPRYAYVSRPPKHVSEPQAEGDAGRQTPRVNPREN